MSTWEDTQLILNKWPLMAYTLTPLHTHIIRETPPSYGIGAKAPWIGKSLLLMAEQIARNTGYPTPKSHG